MDERLTAKELDRLADWLTAQGLTTKALDAPLITQRQGLSQHAGGCPASPHIFIIAQYTICRKSGRK